MTLEERKARPDSEIKSDVDEEIELNSRVDASKIVASVSDGLVTLTGFASNLRCKLNAEIAAQRVPGVAGVANDLQIFPSAIERRSDSEIARRAIDTLRAEMPRTASTVQIVSRDGYVALSGVVQWYWQRQRIEAAIRGISGVVDVSNLLAIQPPLDSTSIKEHIERAFLACATADGKGVVVQTRDGAVTLSGKVHSDYEREEAQRTAWATPGVTEVVNEIEVESR